MTSEADGELEAIKRKKMMEWLKAPTSRIVWIRIFDALVPMASCGPNGCGPSGCGPMLVSPNLTELQWLTRQLIAKYGKNRFRFQLVNILDSSVLNFGDVVQILRERKGDALPIISINGRIAFIGRVPAFEEMDREVKAAM